MKQPTWYVIQAVERKVMVSITDIVGREHKMEVGLAPHQVGVMRVYDNKREALRQAKAIGAEISELVEYKKEVGK